MTRRGIISIHDYPEHLNPFREDDEELRWKYNRKERVGVSVTSRLGSPSQSPAKPERPPLPHRTRHKDKENEVASPDEDKYFRQGAKPKKKRPAPMPPSPNQQKMTPAVSDGSLNSSTGSTSPNVAEVSENAASPAKKVQTQSPQQMQPLQEKNKIEDAPTQNGEHPADISCSPEAKTPSEEGKTPSDNTTPQPEEAKAKTDESKPKSDETKSHSEEKISAPEEAKSQPEERLTEETKSPPEETKSLPEETKPSTEEEKSLTEETITPLEEAKLNGEITVSLSEETKPRNDEESPQKDERIDPPSDTDSPREKKEDASRIRDEDIPLIDSINIQDKTISPAADCKQQEGENTEAAGKVSSESSTEEAKNV